MKILNFIWKFSTGGIGKCFMTYAALSDVDDSMQVVSACVDPQNCSYDREPLKRTGAKIIPIRNLFDFSWVGKIKKLIDEEKPDVIFCHGFNGPIIILFVKSIFHIKIPVICSFHGIYQAPTTSKKLLVPLYNFLQIFIYKYFAKKIITVSNYSNQYLYNKGVPGEKIFTVHNGIKELSEQGSVILPKDVVSIGLVSRLDPIKGIGFLLNAIPEIVKKTHKRFHVYIIGDGPLYQNFRECITTLKIEDYVTMTGYQANISQWLNAIDIFCLPSLSENHSIALLEAMRAGKAIVATKVGGNEESVTNEVEALTVPANDSKALVDALVKLIDSEGLRVQLGKDANKRFNHEFTETIMKRNLVTVFKSFRVANM